MEPHLSPFKTEFKHELNDKKQNFYLITSPELQMKKLLGAGYSKIFNISKVFRNGEVGGGRHNPEFTMLEWYKSPFDYFTLMDQTENLVKFIAKENDWKIENCNINEPWQRISIKDLFLRECNLDLEKNNDFSSLSLEAKKLNLSTAACQNWDDIFFKIFLNLIEPKLGFQKPCFLYDYPSSQAALAKKKESNPFWAERFELYINGQELCNGFSELIDEKEQRERLKEEQILRKSLGKEVFQIDQEFLKSLSKIKQSAAGNALGLDRLLMLFLGKSKIEEVLLFPFSKMLNHQK